jgi:uncharacterized protein YjbJ (UPF0337 family)
MLSFGPRLAALQKWQGGNAMNTDTMKGKFKQMKGEIKRKWGQLTDDDMMEAEGSLDKLMGRIQQRTGERREDIERWFKDQGWE